MAAFGSTAAVLAASAPAVEATSSETTVDAVSNPVEILREHRADLSAALATGIFLARPR
ncbi:hypothetical protein [Luteolibacter yonseiensis]|nr:hypothetical protein [Luteolibacter yonseiensis]